MMKYLTTLLSCVILFSPSLVSAKKLAKIKAGKTYADKDEVHVVVNSVGPFNNPTETYRFYSLPFCQEHDDGKKGAQKHKQRLGESMAGDRRESSPYMINYGENVENKVLCSKEFETEDLNTLRDAVQNSYFFEMYVEDLPMWGYVGDEDYDVAGKSYLFPHLNFKFGMNEDRIVSATINTDVDKMVEITDTEKPIKVDFTYSVEFFKDDLPWKRRMRRYEHSAFMPHAIEIHWLSIINSCVLVLLLTAFLTIIFMRVLKNDFSRYMDVDEETMEEEESGWKLIHGDVFRFPKSSMIFCAAVGTGTQLMITTFVLLLLSLSGIISTTRRGSILAGCVLLYCLTSVIGGYKSTKLFFQMNGKMWARCVLLTAVLFPLPVVAVFAWANTIAIMHGSISALPFGTIVLLAALYALLCVPLTLLGGILAKNFAKKDMEAPTRTTKVAREIPTEVPFLKSQFVQRVIAGFLPFSAIYIELHYIFTSMWGHQIYTMFGILFFAFILLVIVTSSITVSLLYFQLSREDHRWWWATFVNGGMIGFFIYAYSFYFYFHRSGMSGLLQSTFYFGYMSIISFAFFLMLGSAGFQVSLVFVKYIYGRVKCD